MVKTELKPVTRKKEWEDFLKTRSEANFLHSWNWGEFHLLLGHSVYRVGFYQDEKLVGVLLATMETARRGRYLTVPGGPIIDFKDRGQVNLFASEIKRLAKAEGCSFVRVRSQLIQSEDTQKLFANLGFRKAPMHLHAELTNQLDITKSEEELLMGMRKTTRYEIKKALNENIKITTSSSSDEIKNFYTLQLDTARRQKFVPFSFNYLKEQFEVFSQDNQVLLYKAEKDGILLANAFIIFYGQEAVYHYGASTPEGRNFPGAHLIQWEAIREAKRRGLKRYNFWGVAPEDVQNHRFAGLSIFKKGFGGEDFQYLPAQDLVINSPLYLVNFVIETLRRHLRHV